MFILFIGITLRFFALGILTFIAGAVMLGRAGRKRMFRLDLTLFLLLFIVAYIWTYVVLPTPSLATTVIMNLIAGLIAAVLQFVMFGTANISVNWRGFGVHAKSAPKKDVSPNAPTETPSSKFFAKLVGWEIGILIVAIAAFSILNVMEAKRVANLAPVNTKLTTKSAPMPVVSGDNGEVPVVNTPSTVLTQFNNSLSSIPNANVYSVDHVRVQILRDKLTYIAPLDFDGSFFRYLRYRKVDGYFAVNATSKNARPRFVKKQMYYTPAAFFAKDVRRMMYAHSALSGDVLMANTPQLEVDNSGKPYYVATLVKRYGVTSRQDYRHKSVVTVDAETGKTHVYRDLKGKPAWLDVAIDPSTANSQTDAWARERNGWWNANGFGGSRTGVMVAVKGSGTEGEDKAVTPIMYNHNIYYLQSLASAKSAQTSVMGYIYTDAATGKSQYYRETAEAMTPDRAQKLAKDMMKQTGWQPKMPMLYRIDGRPTWVVSMLDSSGAFRAYVYLLASGNGTQDTVATAGTASETLDKYRALFSGQAVNASGKKKNVKGAIQRVSRTGDTISFLIQGEAVVYTISTKDDPLAQFLQSGDAVSFKARVAGNTASVQGKIQNGSLGLK
ncbi:hypothetical protein PQ472_05620 [Lacticaseibacillus pabuli]|uniref:Uncharacterized protein n=1 Tax=Lacticaseibacillus pabuli TaxID=3025672 RepID=A0ABY7WU85_9LACO|nr:hypothetical protein [Lacticaseibacillus sp. KACC 23028]WDF83715.1 hypothetical protein PQ472_05620 [Lacticaseibacillus sp. KACC 23028]